MIDNVRSYPDITFVDADTQTIENELIAQYEALTGRTLYPADPARLFVLWVAEQVINLRQNIDYSAKQNLPRYAEGENLDSLAEIFKDVYRLEAENAQTTLEFTLSTTRNQATIINEGTRVSVGDLFFSTVEQLEIPEGELTGEVAAVCAIAGAVGNNYAPGQITDLVDGFPFYQSVTNTTTSDGGADVEEDAEFYERLRCSMETFSTTGTVGGYEYHALTASALIADVQVTSPVPGQVDIRVILKDGELPSEEIIQKVYDTVNADDVRTLTDYITVDAPVIQHFDIDLSYYIQEQGAISTETIISNVEKAMTEYKTWQCEKMGRDINPSKLTHLLYGAGVKRVEIRSPVFTTVPSNTVAQVHEESVLNGGTEHE
ncbi:MAG: baseplate J/gp47 family protein [Eubacteriales bacterium]